MNGYWLFGFGVLLGLAGVAVFLLTESATTARGIGYALAALAPPFVMPGAVIRSPLRRTGTVLGYLGTAVSVLGVVWFANTFPDGWFTASGDPTVIALYGVGLLLAGLAGTVVPLLSDPAYEDHERMRGEAAAATAERDERSADSEAVREELLSTRWPPPRRRSHRGCDRYPRFFIAGRDASYRPFRSPRAASAAARARRPRT